MGTGLTSSIRPRRYYTIPKETLESTLDDVEQLVNFFVIEIQRILFAERPAVTIAVCHVPRPGEGRANTFSGLPCVLHLLLLDPTCSLLGTLPHRYLRLVPRTVDLS